MCHSKRSQRRHNNGPLGGVAMGSRSGDLDPSVVTYLMSKENMNPAQIDEILNKRSGLLALSGIS